jgi:hypothetical protein
VEPAGRGVGIGRSPAADQEYLKERQVAGGLRSLFCKSNDHFVLDQWAVEAVLMKSKWDHSPLDSFTSSADGIH